MTTILHIIIGLDIGGAELMLKRLVESHRGNPAYRHSVISLTADGKVGAQLRKMGIEVRALGMSSPFGILRALWQLVRVIRAQRPDVVQTWMYHADLIGGIAARLAGNRHVIWGIRCCAIPQGRMSATQAVVSLCSWTSRFLPQVIVCCAESARAVHAERGYDRTKMVVIPNGYDLTRFDAAPGRRGQMRAAFGFHDDDIVVGIIGRYDPLKDYKNFVDAAAVVASGNAHVKFLMVGRGVDPENDELRRWLAEGKLAQKVVLAGERDDIPDCLAAMDLFCLSSAKEGFPNVVCEAMAMKVPCVVTDAGDAAAIVADTGIVVRPRDPAALAAALQKMAEKGAAERARLGRQSRLRVEQNYSMEIAAARFEAVYDEVSY
jgi:glycosyltransferase involved in cell wall biosynthesis